ncbi:MAG: type IV pilus secretin PilQ [Arenimonas sp.]|nr:type IV pilus secretin PilQ [Arenimonas sp.]
MTHKSNNISNSFRSKLSILSTALCLMLAQQSFAANVLKDVKAKNLADGTTTLTFQFEDPIDDASSFDIKSFRTDNPPRISMDFPETTNGFEKKKLTPSTGLAKSVNTVEAGGRTRVLIDLAKNSPTRTEINGKTLVLTIDNKAKANAAVSVAGIDFKQGINGAGRLVVKFDSLGAITNLKENGSEIILDISNAQLPAELRRQMDVADYSTPVLNINASDVNGKTRLVLNTKGKATLSAYQTGNEYVVEISPKASTLASSSQSKASVAKTGAVDSGAKKSVYSGKAVTFNFQDIPVRTVLQLVAEESGLNIVASDTVSGNVTLRLINVPWDQALEIVLRAKGLDQRRDGNVVWVGPQAELAAFELAREDARIALTIRQETVTEYIAINYGNAEAIAKLLTDNSKSGGGGGGGGGGGSVNAGGVSGLSISSGFLSPRGSVTFDTRTNTLLVIDIPKKVAEIKKMMLILDRPVAQVMIEARVVIATDSFVREIGAKFGVSDADQSEIPVSRNVTGTASNLLTQAAGVLNFNFFGNYTNLDIELQAMENDGKGEVISKPHVITANQVEATIKQGEEVAYVTQQVAQEGTIPQSTVQFKDVLLELKVTPTITSDGRVFMKIFVKKDEINGFVEIDTGRIPQIAKREVNTAVLVDNGQTVVIGGVYEFRDRKDVQKVPWLGDIPFLGILFKSTKKDLKKAELLIFVTPRILKQTRIAEE